MGTQAVLRDGVRVTLRTMQPSDAERLVRFHHTLSSDTTQLRFFAVHPELSASELHRFTHVDHRDREAIVAVSAGEIVGVTRFDRIDGGTDAEIAFVVSDGWRGRGLGSLLFAHLAERARRLGIERFVAETLAHNSRMLTLLAHCGLPSSTQSVDGGVIVTIDLAGVVAGSRARQKGPAGCRPLLDEC